MPLLPCDYVPDDGEHVDLMPEPTGATEIAAYESTTEGTPISPAFPDTPQGRLDLVNYCAEHCTKFGDHRADGEAWAAILFGEGATVDADGTVRAQGIRGLVPVQDSRHRGRCLRRLGPTSTPLLPAWPRTRSPVARAAARCPSRAAPRHLKSASLRCVASLL